MRQILCIIHQQTSDPGRIGQLLRAKGYQLDIRCPSLQQELPETLDSHDGVVIFGGPMSANDDQTLPFIRTELDWIPVALASGKPFLGICLGAQLLARVLGAAIAPHPQGLVEIGYFPITPTLAGQAYFQAPLQVYQWHHEGFELPQDAVLLAKGERFTHQAFRYGQNAYGLQFHPEVTGEMLRRWTFLGSEQLVLSGAQSRTQQQQQHPGYDREIEPWLQQFLDCWLGLSSPSNCFVS